MDGKSTRLFSFPYDLPVRVGIAGMSNLLEFWEMLLTDGTLIDNDDRELHKESMSS